MKETVIIEPYEFRHVFNWHIYMCTDILDLLLKSGEEGAIYLLCDPQGLHGCHSVGELPARS